MAPDVGLKKPYQFVMSINVARAVLKKAETLFGSFVEGMVSGRKCQYSFITTKPVKYGIRFEAYVLGLKAPAFEGGATEEEWAEICQRAGDFISDNFPGATPLIQAYGEDRKPQIRFGTYIQYEETPPPSK
jgi:hypothetical protein